MEAIERYSGIFQGDEIRTKRRFTISRRATPFFPTTSCCSATRSFGSGREARAGRFTSGSGAVRSLGQDRVVAGLVAARQALQISSDQPAVFLLPRPGRLPRGFQRLRGRQHARGSHRPGLPRTGGARCLRDLVVQPVAAGGSRPQPVRRFLHPRSARPSLPTPGAGFGCSTSPAISAFPPMWRSCTGCRTAGKYRVRFRRAFRSPHRPAAFADRAEPVPVDRPDGRRQRREAASTAHAAAPGNYPFLTPKRQPDRPPAPARSSAARQHARAGECLRRDRQARGPRFPRARPDAARRRGPGRPGDRSGMRHFYRRFAPGRLYDVPVKLGLRDRPRRKANSRRSFRTPERGSSFLRAPGKSRPAKIAPPHFRPMNAHHARSRCGRKHRRLLRRLFGRLGKFSAAAADRAQESAHRSAARVVCRQGRASTRKSTSWSGDWPARSAGIPPRARARRQDEDQVVIEPQVPDYWPQTPKLGEADTVVLSRFAYLRRRGNEMVLESPRAGALFRICDPKIAAALATLSRTAEDQGFAAAGLFRGSSCSPAAGLPDPVQDRCRRRRRPAGE
jgi:hypothetical protein